MSGFFIFHLQHHYIRVMADTILSLDQENAQPSLEKKL